MANTKSGQRVVKKFIESWENHLKKMSLQSPWEPVKVYPSFCAEFQLVSQTLSFWGEIPPGGV